MTANIHAIMAADLAATAFDAEATESPAIEIAYTPGGGSETDIVGVQVVPEGGQIDFDDAREVAVETMMLAIPADAASGITAPDRGDTLVIDEVGWGVERVESITAGVVAVIEVRKIQQTRQGRRP